MHLILTSFTIEIIMGITKRKNNKSRGVRLGSSRKKKTHDGAVVRGLVFYQYGPSYRPGVIWRNLFWVAVFAPRVFVSRKINLIHQRYYCYNEYLSVPSHTPTAGDKHFILHTCLFYQEWQTIKILNCSYLYLQVNWGRFCPCCSLNLALWSW